MIDAASNFRKNSFNDEDSATLARVSALYQNVADETISASDSASLLISQMKAFNIEADDATKIIDAINEVSNNFAVSSSDIASALTKTSSAMSILGNDFNQSIGLVAAGTEIMTGQAGKVAKGLRSIGNEFANAAQDGNAIEYAVGGVTKQLSLLDGATGDMKSTFQIMSDLKDDWDNMTNAEKQAIAITYAGKTQFEVFAAVMNNFDTAIRASETALNSAGSATEENEKIQESLDFKMQQLSATFQQFSNNVLDKEFVGSVINAGNTLLEFANTSVGTTITKAALLGTTVASSVGMIMAVLSKLKAMLAVAQGSGGIIGALAAPKALLIIGAVVASLTIIANIVRNIKDNTPNLDELNDKLSTNRDRLKELNEVPWYNRDQEWFDEKEALEQYNEELQRTIDLENERKAENEKSKPKYYQVTGTYDVGDGSTYEVLSGEFETMQEAVQNLADMMGTDYNDALEAASAKSRESAFAYGSLLEQYRQGEITEAELNDRTLELGKQYGVLVDEIKQRADAGYELLPMEQALLNISGQMIGMTQSNRDAYYAMSQQMILTNEQYEKLLIQIPHLASEIENTNGVLSINTTALFDAAKAGNEYAAALLNIAYQQAQVSKGKIIENLNTMKIGSPERQAQLDALDVAKKQIGELHGQLGALGTITAYPKSSDIAATTTATGAGGGGGSSVKKTEDYLVALKSKLEKYEHDIFLLTKQGEEKTAQTRINIYKNMQNMIHQRADEIRAMGLENEEELVRELQQLWWGYQDDITDILDFLKEKQIEAIQSTIDALESQKDAYSDLGSLMADYIEGQISKIDEQNQALEDQIKLEEKLDDLAQAKNKRMLVYKDGQFQYMGDADAVSSAQAAYSAEKRTQDAQREKDRLQDLANKWRDFASDYVEAQNKINLEQKLGVDLSDENLERMVNDAQEWADRYIDIMEQIAAKQQQLNALSSGSSGSPTLIAGAKGTLSSYASGTVGARGGLSLVGENGPELRVMRSGDGVIPADVTRNLWNWGKISPSAIASDTNNIFNIDNLTLPNARDAQTLISGLKQMAYQRAYKRA